MTNTIKAEMEKDFEPTEADHQQTAWAKELAIEALGLLVGKARDFEDDPREQLMLITVAIATIIGASARHASTLEGGDPQSVQQYLDYMKQMIDVIAVKGKH